MDSLAYFTLPHCFSDTFSSLLIYDIAEVLTSVVSDHPADDTAENTANDSANGGEGP